MDSDDSEVSITAVATIFTAIAAMFGALVTAGLLRGPDEASSAGSRGTEPAPPPSTSSWLQRAATICAQADLAVDGLDGMERMAQWVTAERTLAHRLRTMNAMLRGLEVAPGAALRVRLMTQNWDDAAAAADRAAAAYLHDDPDQAMEELSRLACLSAVGDQLAFDLGLMECAGARKVGVR